LLPALQEEYSVDHNAAKDPEPGNRLRGRVTKIFNDNVLVDLGNGIEGRISPAHISWIEHKPDPFAFFSVGDLIDVVVLRTHRTKANRLYVHLGYREAHPHPLDEMKDKFPPGSVHAGTVRDFLPFGAAIYLEGGFPGLLHNSELSWTSKARAEDFFQLGQSIRVVVENINEHKRRVHLSYRQLQGCVGTDQFLEQAHTSGFVIKCLSHKGAQAALR
jgi:small subunit ribosomal protein S1